MESPLIERACGIEDESWEKGMGFETNHDGTPFVREDSRSLMILAAQHPQAKLEWR